MRIPASISGAQRLLPPPRETASVAPAETAEPAPPVERVIRPAVWTLSRETAEAALAAQMLTAPRRGLKADAAERARFAAAYALHRMPPAGLIAERQA